MKDHSNYHGEGKALSRHNSVRFLTHFAFSMNFVAYEERAKYLSRIQSDSTFKAAFVRPLAKTLYYNQKHPKNLRYKILMDAILTIPIAMLSQKNFYLLDALNEKIELFKSAGLIDLWQTQDVDARNLKEKEPNYPQILSLHNLIGVFQIWLFGCVISLLAFICEASRLKVEKLFTRCRRC